MNTRYFKFAREAAAQADYQGTRSAPAIGAVAVYKGTIVATASNTNKTSPLQAKFNVYRYSDTSTPAKMHCETALIQRLRWKFGDSIQWDKVHIYLYREHKDGSLACARPCPSCFALFRSVGLKHIYYTTDEGYAEEKLNYKT